MELSARRSDPPTARGRGTAAVRGPARAALLVALSVLLASCGRGAGPSNDADDAPPAPTVQIKPLVPLAAGRRTHAAVAASGTVYWLQETDDGRDTLYYAADGVVPTRLVSAGEILDRLGLNDPPRGGRRGTAQGAIQSVAAGPGDSLFLYLVGGRGRQVIALVVIYFPKSGQLRVAADTSALRDASGMGDALALARGTLVPALAGDALGAAPPGDGAAGNLAVGNQAADGPGRVVSRAARSDRSNLVRDDSQMWLWLRHGDGYALLRFDPTAAKGGGQAIFSKPLPFLRTPDGPLDLTAEGEDLSAGPGGLLYYADRRAAALWRIDATGNATPALSLRGVPESVTPAAPDGTGRLALLAGDAPLLTGQPAPARGARLDPAPAVEPAFPADYPALLLLDPAAAREGRVVVIPRGDFSAPGRFQTQPMQPTLLVPDARAGTWVLYDNASGELLRVNLGTK